MLQTDLSFDNGIQSINPMDLAEELESRFAELQVCAKEAAFNFFLERVLALPDVSLMMLSDIIRTCGFVAEQSGPLLPKLMHQVIQSNPLADPNSGQLHQFLNLVSLDEFEMNCQDTQAIRTAALNALASVLQHHDGLNAAKLREKLSHDLSPMVYQSLLDECRSVRKAQEAMYRLVQSSRTAQASLLPNYEPQLRQLEKLGQAALKKLPRPWRGGVQLPDFLLNK